MLWSSPFNLEIYLFAILILIHGRSGCNYSILYVRLVQFSLSSRNSLGSYLAAFINIEDIDKHLNKYFFSVDYCTELNIRDWTGPNVNVMSMSFYMENYALVFVYRLVSHSQSVLEFIVKNVAFIVMFAYWSVLSVII